MERYDDVQVRITIHAYQQYCDRVEKVDADELRERCQAQWDQREVSYCHRGFLHLSGVWWVFDRCDCEMTFITCYGRTSLNIPKALQWAARNKDRINLHSTI